MRFKGFGLTTGIKGRKIAVLATETSVYVILKDHCVFHGRKQIGGMPATVTLSMPTNKPPQAMLSAAEAMTIALQGFEGFEACRAVYSIKLKKKYVCVKNRVIADFTATGTCVLHASQIAKELEK
jgi:hypothetical protein